LGQNEQRLDGWLSYCRRTGDGGGGLLYRGNDAAEEVIVTRGDAPDPGQSERQRIACLAETLFCVQSWLQ
jgi:hypothetical protein